MRLIALAGGVAGLILTSQFARADVPLDIGDCIAPLPSGYSQPLFSGLGDHHHPVDVRGPDARLAQAYFDQGLTLVWAFNHPEAIHSFARAAQYDPDAPMPLWGIAMAAGPDINTGATQSCLVLARTAIQMAIDKARSRAKEGSEQKGLAEQDLAHSLALAKRFTVSQSGEASVDERAYAAEMKKLVDRYPDDVNLATFYAAAEMNVDAWNWWIDGKPTPEATRAITILRRVLERNADHLGANHYMIHALEESPHPEQALASAERIADLAPGAGHIVHMPSHIYRRIGDHARASSVNYDAVAVDRLYLRQAHQAARYPLHYLGHNIHFLARSLTAEGRQSEALASAQELMENTFRLSTGRYNELHNQTLAAVKNDYFFAVPILIAARFEDWDHRLMLRMREMLDKDLTRHKLPYTRTIWAYADVLRYLSENEPNPNGTLERLDRFWALTESAPPDLAYGDNKAAELFKLANLILLARSVEKLPKADRQAFTTEAASRLRDNTVLKQQAALLDDAGGEPIHVLLLRRAVEIHDGLSYNEPPDWYYPVRESLGAALYRHGRFAEAESVFREDLKRDRGSGRALFGLIESLRAQNKKVPDELARKFRHAWKNSPLQLSMDQL